MTSTSAFTVNVLDNYKKVIDAISAAYRIESSESEVIESSEVDRDHIINWAFT